MKFRTLLLTTLAAMASFTAFADEEAVIVNQWNEVFALSGSKNQTTVDNIIKSTDGSFFTLAHYATQGTETEDIQFFGYSLAKPSATLTAASTNTNLVLVKHDAKGKPQWCVNSINGDVNVQGSAAVATSDGGIILFLKARHRLVNTTASIVSDTLINLKGSDDAEHVIEFDYMEESGAEEYSNVYQPVIAKISADGVVTFIRRAYADYTIPSEIESTLKSGIIAMTDPFTFDCATMDEEDGTLYVAGIMSGDLKFFNNEGGNTTIAHHNLSGWDGNVQTTRGNAFLARFNSNMQLIEYKTTLAEDGGSNYDTYNTYDRICAMKCVDGTIYTTGLVKSLGNNMQFGNVKTSTGTSGMLSIWTTVMDASTFQVEKIELCAAEESTLGNNIQIKNMTLSSDGKYVYTCGSLLGVINVSGTSVSSKTAMASGKGQLNSFLLRVATSNGAIKDATCTEVSGISGLYSVIDNGTDSIFVFGYDMGRKSPESNIVFESYSHSDLTMLTRYDLFSGTNATTSAWPCFAVSGDTIMLAGRYKTAVTPYGESESFGGTTAFYGAASCFTFDGFNFSGEEITAAKESSADVKEVTIYASNDNITVEGAEGEALAVYSLAGTRVAATPSAPKKALIPVGQKGLYIVKTDSATKKVLVK